MKILTDNNPGKPRWWFQYAVYKVTGYCDHKGYLARYERSGRRWEKADEHCKMAWDSEYSYLMHPEDWVEDPAPEDG